MREILFKGKRVDNEEWIYGYLFNILDMAFILSGVCVVSDGSEPTPNMYQVIPSTIRQFTGLLDKNGKKIFEGDILAVLSPMRKKEEKAIKQVVEWKEYKWIGINEWGISEIIGNIHDNPELLEKV